MHAHSNSNQLLELYSNVYQVAECITYAGSTKNNG